VATQLGKHREVQGLENLSATQQCTCASANCFTQVQPRTHHELEELELVALACQLSLVLQTSEHGTS